MVQPLTKPQQETILSCFPAGSRIVAAAYFQQEYLPCPVKVTVALPDGVQETVVLRLVRHRDASLAREVALLPILRNAGIPVPEVLLVPQHDPAQPSDQEFAVYSFLPGTNCQELAETSTAGCQAAMVHVVNAARTLAGMTDVVQTSAIHPMLPTTTLRDKLASCEVDHNVWLVDERVTHAVARLKTLLEKLDSPVVFTNGDYQAANFLVAENNLIGYVDFEYACYQDFLYGFVKYPIYDLRPLNKAGMINYLMSQIGADSANFALRLAIGCLKTLQREIAIDEANGSYGRHVLSLLADAMQTLDN